MTTHARPRNLKAGYLSLANAMCWACWPHDCPRVVLSTTGLVSCAARYLEWVDSL